ncbi:type II secretion system protein M [Vibrio agarivorans]|uniref:type II secretion system protein M n=1 Tax=Vibrio agarivorans TaxID=153622 RepID=UPI0022305C74|nr:type II secretion system protein M [Vibrio agarivorans]
MMEQLATVKNWWQGLSQREQRLVGICVGFTLLGILYWGLVQPLQARAENARMRIDSERQLLSWVSSKADEVTELRAQGGIVTSNQPLNQLIYSSASRYKVEIIRMTPRDDMMQVWVQPIPFEQLLNWVTYLKEQQGVEVAFLDVDRSERAGVVDVKRLQFQKGGN